MVARLLCAIELLTFGRKTLPKKSRIVYTGRGDMLFETHLYYSIAVFDYLLDDTDLMAGLSAAVAPRCRYCSGATFTVANQRAALPFAGRYFPRPLHQVGEVMC